MSDRPEKMTFFITSFLKSERSCPVPDDMYLVTQCGGVMLGGNVEVGDVDAAGLVHLDHVVTKLKVVLVITKVTLLGATEETN